MTRPTTARSPWWIVVGAATALVMGNGPVMQFTFGVFLQPVAAEFHAQRGTVSIALMVGLCATGLSAPIVGRLVDRFGVRRVVLPAIVLLAVTIACLGLVTDIWQFTMLYGVAGLIAGGQTPLPYARAVATAFDARRGLALGIAMAGVGIGTMVVPQVAQWLIVTVGWRAGYLGLAVLLLVVALPAAGLLVRESGAATSGSSSASSGLRAGLALRTTGFWLMAASFFLVTLTATGVAGHVVPLLMDRGVPATKAALALGVAGAAMIVGRLLSGWLLDTIAATRVALVFFCLQLGGIALLLAVDDISSALIASFFVGLGLGAEVDLIAYMLARLFGTRAFGTLYGVLFGIFMLASGLGPLAMGAAFQISGRYDGALWLFCLVMPVACGLMVMLDPLFRMPRMSSWSSGEWSAGALQPRIRNGADLPPEM